ncbi:hypothetical protein PFLUV_G00035030 [Perca fluviatilis]|uniref:Trans-1,2-dihydrobenzene-1,2-diol dehydrogenase n=1 Tax=Perca fluviatilis TaxID=8168 RepID=A0A6A5EU80_PERFL|nr:hypothetical protein PFLUV_G00035030 [Perca fluviatilis]
MTVMYAASPERANFPKVTTRQQLRYLLKHHPAHLSLTIQFNMATRWGLRGAGKISHDFSVVTKTPPPGDHQIAVIASRSLERAKEFAKRHSIPKAYGSYEELANDPDVGELRAASALAAQAEIIACCCLKLSLEHLCPHRLGVLHTEHWRVGLLFLKAGKNVLCEKLFAMNSGQVKDLVAAAKKNNVFLMEAIWSRCFRVHAEVRSLLAEEE